MPRGGMARWRRWRHPASPGNGASTGVPCHDAAGALQGADQRADRNPRWSVPRSPSRAKKLCSWRWTMSPSKVPTPRFRSISGCHLGSSRIFTTRLQLVTPLVVAMSANSPTLFGHRLWQETRIPLFSSSLSTVDPRTPCTPFHCPGEFRLQLDSRWCTGTKFAEAALLYRPILPDCNAEDSVAVAKSGGTPSLHPNYACLPGFHLVVEPAGIRPAWRRPPAHRDAPALLCRPKSG